MWRVWQVWAMVLGVGVSVAVSLVGAKGGSMKTMSKEGGVGVVGVVFREGGVRRNFSTERGRIFMMDSAWRAARFWRRW